MDLAARDLRPVPAVPMAVVVAAKYFAVPLTVPFDLQQHFQADLRYRLRVLSEWVLASPHGTLVMANNTTHTIHREDPALMCRPSNGCSKRCAESVGRAFKRRRPNMAMDQTPRRAALASLPALVIAER
jgi:hypothetical protein